MTTSQFLKQVRSSEFITPEVKGMIELCADRLSPILQQQILDKVQRVEEPILRRRLEKAKKLLSALKEYCRIFLPLKRREMERARRAGDEVSAESLIDEL